MTAEESTVPNTATLAKAKMKPTQFKDLCPEIKNLIWKATWESRIVCLGTDPIGPRHFGFTTHSQPPVSLWVNRHSRHETLRYYRSMAFKTDHGIPSYFPSRWAPIYEMPPDIVLNPDLDIVSFHDSIGRFAGVEKSTSEEPKLSPSEMLLQVVNLFNIAMPGSWSMIKYIEMGGNFWATVGHKSGDKALASQRFVQLVEVIFQSPTMQGLSIYRDQTSRDDMVDELWFRIARRPLSWDTDPDIAALPCQYEEDSDFDADDDEDIKIVNLMNKHQAVPLYSDGYPPGDLAIFEVHRGPGCICHWSPSTWYLHQEEDLRFAETRFGDVGEDIWDDLHRFYEAFVWHWDEWCVGIVHGICAHDYKHPF